MSRVSEKRAWTVMVFLCGDNDLEPSAVADLREMQRAGSTDDLAILVEFDRYHVNAPTRRYYIRRNLGLAQQVVGPPLGETNAGNPKRLINFATWCMKNYPAEHYMLVVWNHGMGWDDSYVYARANALVGAPLNRATLGHLRTVRRRAPRALFAPTLDHVIRAEAIGFDDHQMDFLDNQEMKKAVEAIRRAAGRKLDIIGLDACLMSMGEVLYQLQGGAERAVASEEVIPLEGWPYAKVLNRIRDKPSITPDALAKAIVDDFCKSYGATRRVNLAATDLKKIAPLYDAVSELGKRLVPWCKDDAKRAVITRARHAAWRSDDTPDYVDLGTFCKALKKEANDAELLAACKKVLDVLDDGLVIHVRQRGKAKPPVSGMTMWIPAERPRSRTMRLYEALGLVKGSGWIRFVKEYAQ